MEVPEKLSSHSSSLSLSLWFLFLCAAVGPTGVFAATPSERPPVVVRFGPGEIQVPDESASQTIAMEFVAVRSERLRAALSQVGVTGLSFVCQPWRHLQAPQYDINGEEISVQQMVDFADVYKLEWTAAAPAEEVQAVLAGLEEVVYAEIMTPLELDFDPPNDEYFPDQWGLDNQGQTYPEPCVPCSTDFDINALEAWDYQDSCRVKIGILDTGIDYDHEDLTESVDPNLHYGPDNGHEEIPCAWPHGTAVAGIVGATGGDSVGISGVASPRGGRFLVSMRAIQNGYCNNVNSLLVPNALAWATSDSVFPAIPIVNSSFVGGRAYEGGFPDWYATVRDAYRNAYLKGLVLPAAAGNKKSSPIEQWPATFADYTIAVAAVRCDGTHSPDYNVGTWIDVAAPGGAINDSTLANIVAPWGEGSGNDDYWGVGAHQYFGGTSAATPHVTGVVGLILSNWPVWASIALTNDDVDGLLKATAMDLGDQGWDVCFGYGLTRADAALELIGAPHEIHRGAAALSRISYVGSFAGEFMNIPCITREQPESLSVAVYEMAGYGSFADSALAVWTRGRQSVGWRDLRPPAFRVLPALPMDGLAKGNWAEVIPETVTAEGCSLRAYTYKFYRDSTFVGWYPVNGDTGQPACSAGDSTVFAYTYFTAGDDS